jgi:hypothetical protein
MCEVLCLLTEEEYANNQICSLHQIMTLTFEVGFILSFNTVHSLARFFFQNSGLSALLSETILQ